MPVVLTLFCPITFAVQATAAEQLHPIIVSMFAEWFYTAQDVVAQYHAEHSD